MPTLTRDGPDGTVAVLDLGDTPRALVTTATGRFFFHDLKGLSEVLGLFGVQDLRTGSTGA